MSSLAGDYSVVAAAAVVIVVDASVVVAAAVSVETVQVNGVRSNFTSSFERVSESASSMTSSLGVS